LILEEPQAIAMLKHLDELQLLAAIHPALANISQSSLVTTHVDDPLLQNRNSRWVLWLMHLENQQIESINDRLHFPSELLNLLHSAVTLNANLSDVLGLRPSKTVEFLESFSIKAIEIMSVAVQDLEIKNILKQYLSHWSQVKPKTTGHDLKKLGIPPGPKYREILRHLRAAWLDGEINSEEEEKKLLNNLVEKA
jgi:tRNA nucleotidyltransferase (CCA-adding enzyme)